MRMEKRHAKPNKKCALTLVKHKSCLLAKYYSNIIEVDHSTSLWIAIKMILKIPENTALLEMSLLLEDSLYPIFCKVLRTKTLV